MADPIVAIELEEGKKDTLIPENLQLQKDKLRCSHPYDGLFLRHYWDVIAGLISKHGYTRFVFIGAGSGNDAAYISTRINRRDRLVLTDLSGDMLKYYPEVFANYSAAVPDMAVVCDFNRLPFNENARGYCLVAFLCLHHSRSAEALVGSLLEKFDSVIICEPLSNPLLDFLARLGIARRPENREYAPSRISSSLGRNLAKTYSVDSRFFLQVPRDYLPLLSRKQQVVFSGNRVGRAERLLSKIYFAACRVLNAAFSWAGFSNMVILHIRRGT